MPVLASLSVSRLAAAFERMGVFPWADAPHVFVRQSDNLMFFPDVDDNERVVLMDVLAGISDWDSGEGLVEKFLDFLFEVGGLD